MLFCSINLMPAGVSPLNDVCKICQVEALALLLTSILTFSYISKYDHPYEIVAALHSTFMSELFYTFIPYFIGMHLISGVDNALKYRV